MKDSDIRKGLARRFFGVRYARVRFGSRALMVSVAILCVWVGLQANDARQQRLAVEWVKANGGQVYYDFEWPEGEHGPLSGEPPPRRSWVASLLGEDFLSSVVVVHFHKGYNSVTDLELISSLRHLRELRLRCELVSDISPLRSLISLKRLDLSYSGVTDLTPLSSLGLMDELSLYCTNVRDVTPLARVTSLRVLNLASTHVSDVSPLLGLGRLQSVHLNNTAVSKHSVEELRHALPHAFVLN